MNRVFVTADTHFNHKRVPEFRPWATVEEHDREIIARWNAVVNPKDTVWHLGDVWFGKDGHLALAELNGNKRLVMGNHDRFPMAVYQQYFTKIHGAVEHSDCILTHVPIHTQQLERYRKNIHGHLHSNELPDDRYVCVSMEHTNYAPVLIHELLK